MECFQFLAYHGDWMAVDIHDVSDKLETKPKYTIMSHYNVDRKS